MSQLDFGVSGYLGHIAAIDKKLREIAPKNIAGSRRLIEAKGKRLRPSLVIATAYYYGKKIDGTVINAASSVELVHLATLIHDDIMDSGTLRWNVSTINSEEGVNSAILAGDYFIAKGCALAACVGSEAGRILSETIARLCEGQAIELKDNFNLERTAESLISAIEGKTSSLFSASLVLGGMVAGAEPKEIIKLEEFGNNFGIAFQFMDDIADFEDTKSSAGKSVGNDIREGNYTLPVILSLNGPNKVKLKKLLEQNAATERIKAILRSDNSFNRVLDEAQKYKFQALNSLKQLENAELAKALESFTERIIPVRQTI